MANSAVTIIFIWTCGDIHLYISDHSSPSTHSQFITVNQIQSHLVFFVLCAQRLVRFYDSILSVIVKMEYLHTVEIYFIEEN